MDEVTCFLCHRGLVAEPGMGALCTGPLCLVSHILSWRVLAGSSSCVNDSERKCDFSEMKTDLWPYRQFCGGCSKMET